MEDIVERSLHWLPAVVLSAIMTLGLSTSGQADDANTAYVVTYIEVAPAAAAEARGLLKQYRDASRKEDGSLRFETLQRTERRNHFAIVEAWKDQQAQAAHAGAAHTKEFREKLQRLLSAAYDERPHIGLSVGPPPAAAGAGAVYVVTHVDIVPTHKDHGVSMVKTLAERGRQAPGALRFDALTQSSRHNHMTVVETWKDAAAFEAHIMASPMKKFREGLTPISGSLYDERLYALID
jgi:quinol monooxygenase YgiN